MGGAAGQARPGSGRGADGRGAGRDRGRHDRHRRPGPDVPQGDRQGAAAQRRGRGRPGQGDRARRADHRRAAEGRPLAVGVDQERDRDEDARQVTRSIGCRTRTRPSASSRGAFKAAEKDGLLQPTPDFHFVKAQQGGRAATRPRRRSRRPAPWSPPTTRRPTADSFTELVDFAFRAVHTRRRRGARQPRPARAVRLDARGRPRGAAALDLRRQGRRAAGRDGLDARAGPVAQAARPARRAGAHRPRGPRAADLAPTCGWSCRSPRSTSAAACRSWT